MTTTSLKGTTEVEEFVREFSAAVAAASDHISKAKLQVSEIAADINTTVETKAGGEIDLKIVKLGADVTHEHVTTVSVSFKPSVASSLLDTAIDEELVRSLAVIQAAVSAIGNGFELSSASVEVGITKTVAGKIQVFIGGERSKADTHTAKLTFESKK